MQKEECVHWNVGRKYLDTWLSLALQLDGFSAFAVLQRKH